MTFRQMEFVCDSAYVTNGSSGGIMSTARRVALPVHIPGFSDGE